MIPKGNDNKVEFDCGALLQTVRRVAVMSNERSRALRLEFAENKLTVRAEEDEQGAAEETLEIVYDGEPTAIGMNAGYLAEYLAVLGSGAISFEFKDGKSAVQIRPLAEPGYNSLNVIMPMNLGDVTPAAKTKAELSAESPATEEQTTEEQTPVAQAA